MYISELFRAEHHSQPVAVRPAADAGQPHRAVRGAVRRPRAKQPGAGARGTLPFLRHPDHADAQHAHPPDQHDREQHGEERSVLPTLGGRNFCPVPAEKFGHSVEKSGLNGKFY